MDGSRLREMVRRRIVPWIVWSGLVVAAIFLARDARTAGGLRGYAENTRYHLGAVEVARVEQVMVKVGSRVHAGQVVATLDAAALEKEIALTQAERAKTEAEIAKTQAEAIAQHTETSRQKQRDQGELERARSDAKTEIDAARAALTATQAEIARRRGLVEQGLAGQDQLAELQIRAAELKRTISGREAEVALFKTQETDFGTRTAPDADVWTKTQVDPVREQLKVLDAQLAVLVTRRDGYVLRAPVDGIVSAVLAEPMAVAAPGATLLEIVPEGSARIVACVGEEFRVSVSIGLGATAHSAADPTRALTAKAVSLGPVSELPERCWREPKRPSWGRTVILELTTHEALVPGESFDIRFDDDVKG